METEKNYFDILPFSGQFISVLLKLKNSDLPGLILSSNTDDTGVWSKKGQDEAFKDACSLFGSLEVQTRVAVINSLDKNVSPVDKETEHSLQDADEEYKRFKNNDLVLDDLKSSVKSISCLDKSISREGLEVALSNLQPVEIAMSILTDEFYKLYKTALSFVGKLSKFISNVENLHLCSTALLRFSNSVPHAFNKEKVFPTEMESLHRKISVILVATAE